MPSTTHENAIADRFAPLGTTIFATMTQLAAEHNAINLSQGFPDFEGPEFIKDAAARAMRDRPNQYARPGGEPALVEALANRWHHDTGQTIDPMTSVTVTAGCTGALAATFLGLFNPGDEVIVFEPFYDSYRACCAMAGVRPRFVSLTPVTDDTGRATFAFDPEALRSSITPRTRAILLNTPHNPTGKVFSRDEMDLIASLCTEHDLFAVTDEVYEHLTFEDDLPHIRLATLPGMADRTVTLSSLGKTFSLTGWKIGWAIAPPHLTAGLRSAHQFLTFCVPPFLQHGAAEAIRNTDQCVANLMKHYRWARRYLADALSSAGLSVIMPEGTYFIMADHTPLGFPDDVTFCTHLTRDLGVAAIPPSAFYSHPHLGKHLARFAFCKTRDTLERAADRIARLEKWGGQ